VTKRSQEPRHMNEISHLRKAEQRLKTCEDYTSCRKITASVFFWGGGTLKASVLFIGFLTEQRIINATFYSKLLKDRVKPPAFRSKRRGRSAISVCLLHDKARMHTAAVTTGTLKEMQWEVLPHPAYSPDLVPSDFHLLSPIKEAL
jgi:hypothetical protein